MITSFQVGSIFEIIDKASPVLSRLSKQVSDFSKLVADTKKELQSLGNLKLTGLNTSLKKATDQVAALTEATDKASSTIVASSAKAEASIAALTRSFGDAAKAAASVGQAARSASGVPLVGRRTGNPRQGVAGWHAANRGGGFHVGGGDVAMGAGLALFEAINEESRIEDAIYQMKWHANLASTPANDKWLRNLIQGTAATTGFGYSEIAEAATDEIRLLKGAGGKENAGLDILPEMLRAAATEARVKPGTTLKGAMDSMVEIAHQAQQYGVDDIKGMAPFLAFLSTTNPATLPQMGRASSYAMPLLHSGLNMDPADILLLSTSLARAGATNSKSGTWLRSAFENALPPLPSSVSAKAYQRKMSQLKALGLVDDQDHSTILDASGKIDINKYFNTIQSHLQGMTIQERNSNLSVLGERGKAGLELLSTPATMAAMAELKKEFPNFKSRYGTFFEDYAKNSPVQQARQSWQDLLNVLTDIGQVALPPLLGGLKQFDDMLKGAASLLPSSALTTKPGSFGNVVAKTGEALTTGGLATPQALTAGLEWLRSFWKRDGKNATKQGAQIGSEAGSEKGTEAGASKGIWEGLKSFFGASSDSGLFQNASYETVGDGGFTTVNGVTVPNSVLRTGRGAGGARPISGGIAPDLLNVVGNAYIANQRAGFAKELKDPKFRSQFAAMLLAEGPTLGTAESAYNRAAATGHSLHDIVTGQLGRKFYSTYGRFIHGTRLTPTLNDLINKSLSSDTIEGATDQGMWNDPNGPGRQARKFGHPLWYKHQHGNYYGDWHAIDSRTGHNSFTDWREHFEAGAHASPGTTDSATSTQPAPSSGSSEIHVHSKIDLDGRTVAKSVTKHIAKEGNAPARGGRLPDYFVTRPLSI